VTVVDNAKSSGIEILASSPDAPAIRPPTVASAAAANPKPVTGATATLSVLGADDTGEANLTYTWGRDGHAPGRRFLLRQRQQRRQSTTATFSKAGTYTLTATIKDSAGASVTSSVDVVVNQTLTRIT